jgi:hypothetical protein
VRAPRSVVAIASLLALGIGVAGCGSSARQPSKPDQAALKRIDGLLSTLTRLDGQINDDPVAGIRVRGHSQYVRTQTPLIDQFGRASLQLRQEVASLHDAAAARLYAPLAEAIDRQAGDLKSFVNFAIARDAAGAKRAHAQVLADRQQVNSVALEQFPKVRAYVAQFG